MRECYELSVFECDINTWICSESLPNYFIFTCNPSSAHAFCSLPKNLLHHEAEKARSFPFHLGIIFYKINNHFYKIKNAS